MPVATRLNPAQWQLLLRANHRNGSIVGIAWWLLAADAAHDDLAGLVDARLVQIFRNSEPVDLPTAKELQASTGFVAHLTHSGATAARQMLEEHRVLAYLDNLSSTWVPVRHLSSDAGRWEALLRMDEAGLIQARRLGSEQILPLATWRNPAQRQGVVVKITAKGKPYARRWDV